MKAGRKVGRMFPETNKQYEKYFPLYKDMDKGSRCITRAHYNFQMNAGPAFIAGISLCASVVIAISDDYFLKWLGGIIFIIMLFTSGVFFRRASVHLSIIEDVEKSLEEERWKLEWKNNKSCF